MTGITFNRAQAVSLMSLATSLPMGAQMTVTDVAPEGSIGIRAHTEDAFQVEVFYRLPRGGGCVVVYDKTPPQPPTDPDIETAEGDT